MIAFLGFQFSVHGVLFLRTTSHERIIYIYIVIIITGDDDIEYSVENIVS